MLIAEGKREGPGADPGGWQGELPKVKDNNLK